MRERLKRVVLKTTVRETVPGVRIPLPPPVCVQRHSLTGDDSVFPSRASDSGHPLSVLGCLLRDSPRRLDWAPRRCAPRVCVLRLERDHEVAVRDFRDERPVEREERLVLVAFAVRLRLLERLRLLLRDPLRLAALGPARLELVPAARGAGGRIPVSLSSALSSAVSSAVWRLTSLLKLLISPLAVSSCTISARFLSSKLSNHSSQEISSRDSPPLYPGKSRRIMPTSSATPVPLTRDGRAPRSSAHCLISS